MKIVKEPILRSKLVKMAEAMFGDLVKAVVDVEKEIVAINGELHSREIKDPKIRRKIIKIVSKLIK